MSQEVPFPVDRLTDIYVCVRDGRLEEWNGRLLEATGRDPAALGELDPMALFADADREQVSAALERARETGSARVTAVLESTTGTDARYEFALSGPTDGGDGVVGIGRRLDGRSERERRDRRAVRRMTDAVATVDADWRITFVDPRAEEIVGMTREALLGELIWNVFGDMLSGSFEDQLRRAMQFRESTTAEEYFEEIDAWIRVTVYPDDDGGLSCYFRDVSERHRHERALEERERVLRKMYEITADGERPFAERVEELLAIGREVLGTPYGTLSRIEGEDYVFEVVSAADDAVAAGDVTELSATNCERTAATEETLVLANIARDAPELTDKAGFTDWGIACYLGAPVVVDGEVYGTFCFYDVEPREEPFSEWEVTLVDLMAQWVSYEQTRRRTYERLEDRTERLNEFASFVSHDLRNPLSVARGRLDLAREECDSSHLDDVDDALDRMTALIDDLLDLAREGRTATDLEAVDLAGLARRSWGDIEVGSATLEVAGGGRVRADESQLRQLLVNLLRNAVQHAGENATVTVGSLPDGFYVADDGPGLGSDDPDQVFESGYTTDPEGNGLGLTVVARVADAHGWDLGVTESEPGGARFEVTGVDVVDG